MLLLMPWTCASCGGEVETDETSCPACAAPKTSWTLVREKTRAFVLAGKKFELLRGEAREVAQRAPVIGKDAAKRLSAEGALPSPAQTLFVRLHPKQSQDLTVKVTPEFETLEAVAHTFQPFEPTGAEGWVDVPLVLVHGPEGLDGIAFAGAHVVDVTEETERGHAPALEVKALGKPARSVPLAVDDAFLSARFTDRTGRRVVADRALTVEGVPARTDAEGRVVVPALPLIDLTVVFEDGEARVPAVHDPEIVVEARLRFVTEGGAEATVPARDEARVARPTSLYAESSRADDDAGEREDDDVDPGHDDHDHDADWCLAAVLLDRTGRWPLVRRDVVVGEVAGETDEHGLVVLEGMEPGDLSLEVEGGHTLLVPAVHDPSLVIHARVPTADAADEDREAALPPPDEDEDGPGALWEPGDEDEVPEPEPEGVPMDVPDSHDHDYEGAGA